MWIIHLVECVRARRGGSLRLRRLLLQIRSLKAAITPLRESFLGKLLLFGNLGLLLLFLDFLHLGALDLGRGRNLRMTRNRLRNWRA